MLKYTKRLILIVVFRFPTCTCMTVCSCWPMLSTENWRTGNGTAWQVWTAWGNPPSLGMEDDPC